MGPRTRTSLVCGVFQDGAQKAQSTNVYPRSPDLWIGRGFVFVSPWNRRRRKCGERDTKTTTAPASIIQFGLSASLLPTVFCGTVTVVISHNGGQNIRFVVTGADVIHDFAVPSLGLKIDVTATMSPAHHLGVYGTVKAVSTSN